jgi:methionyl-tRNA formyltransferase
VRVLFWGTPEFATPCLRALIGEGFEVVAVVTQPDRATGRSRSTLQPPPVKTIALEESIPVLQPEKPRDEEFLNTIAGFEPDIGVVVAYGHILTQRAIDTPSLGTVNVHASLLPRLRGAAPIQASIREGHDETGVTIMRVIRALDAGPMLLQARTAILDDETYGELALRLSELGALALVEALSLVELRKAVEEPQDEALATYAPKVDRSMTRIDWGLDARGVSRTIRAYDPKPGAVTVLHGQEVKLFGARPAPRTVSTPPGTVDSIGREGMIVACGEGAIRVAAVQPAGKRRLSPDEWARGRGVSEGDRFDAESHRLSY